MRVSPLVVLALGSFAIGMTEFSPMGLLPVIAQDFGVSIPKAGLLVTAYAFGVAIASPIITISSLKISKRLLLILLMGIFTLGNLLSAASTNFDVLFVSRIITSLCQGTFFGVGSVVAATLVRKDRQAAAIATVFSGLTVANVIGVPFLTWLGSGMGWRIPFLLIALLGMVVMFALRVSLPDITENSKTSISKEFRVLKRLSVITALILTVISSTGQFTLFTYIAPILINETNMSPLWVSVSLVVVGAGMSVGNLLGGKAADRSLMATLIVCFGVLLASLLIFQSMISIKWAVIAYLFVWGALVFALVPALQMRVMKTASEAPILASTLNIGAFNLGNGLGAALGGAVLSLGFDYADISVVSGLVFLLAIIFLCLISIREAKTTNDNLDQKYS